MESRGAKTLLTLLLAGLLGPAACAQAPAPPSEPAPMPAAAPPGVPPQFTDAAEPWTLERLEALAEQYHPILPRDRAQVEAAQGQAVQAGLWHNPEFNTNNPQVINGRNSALNVGFMQELPVMGKKRLDQAAATEGARQAEITYYQDRFSLLTAVRQQFYQVLADQQRLQVLQELDRNLREAYQAGQKLQKAGESSRANVLVLLVDLQRVEAQLQSAQVILACDRKQLAATVGIPGLVVGRAVSGLFVGGYPVFDEELIRGYVSLGHTQVRYAESVIQQNRYQLRRAEVEPYPNPQMGPAYQYGLVPGNDQFWFNIQFPIPVWDRNQGKIRAARANLGAAQEDLRNTQNTLLNQAAGLLSQYRAALVTVRQYEAGILPNTRESVRLAREGYTRGQTDFVTFLTVQRTYVQASSDYVDALSALWIHAIQLAGLLQRDHFP